MYINPRSLRFTPFSRLSACQMWWEIKSIFDHFRACASIDLFGSLLNNSGVWVQLKFNHTCTTVKDLHSTCLKWSVSKFFYFYVWLISLNLGEDWLVLISKLWVQQDISSVWNCVPVMQIAFRSISAEIGCSASWIHNTRRTLSQSRKISQRQGILFISQKHLSQTWVFNWMGGGGVGGVGGVRVQTYLKYYKQFKHI